MNKLSELKFALEASIIGHSEMVEHLLIALLCKGHILIEGVPGLAKTTAIKLLAKSSGASFKRVQFTPDLLPSDILGSEIYDPKENAFKIKHGPVFTNMLLADEINRSPAKVQSALLEVMEERQVTIGDQTFPLAPPFMVLATQNPIESHGAYELPEAQLDRFMLKSIVSYNTKEDELKVARAAQEGAVDIAQVLNLEELNALQTKIGAVHTDPELEAYMVDIVDATRYPENYGLPNLADLIEYGSGTRGSINLFKASKAKALLENRDYVTPEDILAIAKPVLRHRIVLSYEAEATNFNADAVIDTILQKIDAP